MRTQVAIIGAGPSGLLLGALLLPFLPERLRKVWLVLIPVLTFARIVALAKEVGVEVHSMSKGFNMIGWRLGFVCGHPKIVQAYADVKDNSDSGQFMATQQAAAAAGRRERPGSPRAPGRDGPATRAR